MTDILSGMIVETTTTVDGGTTVLAIKGILNLGNSLVSIEHAIGDMIAAGVRRLIVDLSNLDRIDSSGIGMLIASGARMEQAGGKFRVAGPRGIVAESFKITHMDRVVPVDPDLDAARVAINAGQESRNVGA